MKEWYLSRTPRERVVLAAGVVAVALIVFWQFVWTPLRNGSVDLSDSVAQKSHLLIDLQRAAAIAPSEEASGGSPGDQSLSLVVLVDRTAQTHGLEGALTRTRPDGTDGINVTFQNASFDALTSWLVTLQTSYGVGVESASVNGTRAPGLVDGQIFLRRVTYAQ